MFNTKRVKTKLALLCSVLLLTGIGCKPTQDEIAEIRKVSLTYWQVWQNSSVIEPLIEAYKEEFPNVTINFRKLRFEEYEEEMLRAHAEDRGPDIFSIPHDYLGMYENAIAPEPESVTIQRIIMKPPGIGELKPTISKIYDETVKLLSPEDIKNNYHPFIKDDVLKRTRIADERGAQKLQEQVLALPLYVDTLAMYYNLDVLEKYDLFEPAKTWEEFQQHVILMTQLDENNHIVQPAAAMGTTKNLTRPTDILVALMLQTGVEMFDDKNTQATFHESIREADDYNAGLEALRFYTDFSDVTKRVYTWDRDEEDALGQFKQGKLAYFFGYAYHLRDLESGKVNLGVAPLPQPVGAVSPVTTAKYWVETVSKKSKQQDQAWHFLNFLSRQQNLLQIQAASLQVSPLRTHAANPTGQYSVFANQAAFAEVWYYGKDAPGAEDALEEMIDAVVTRELELNDALRFGAQKVTQTLK